MIYCDRTIWKKPLPSGLLSFSPFSLDFLIFRPPSGGLFLYSEINFLGSRIYLTSPRRSPVNHGLIPKRGGICRMIPTCGVTSTLLQSCVSPDQERISQAMKPYPMPTAQRRQADATQAQAQTRTHVLIPRQKEAAERKRTTARTTPIYTRVINARARAGATTTRAGGRVTTTQARAQRASDAPPDHSRNKAQPEQTQAERKP